MTQTQEELIIAQIEKLANDAMTLFNSIDSTAYFVDDNGGFANPSDVPANLVNAYNALLQIRALLNGWETTQANYRQVLNQALPSPR